MEMGADAVLVNTAIAIAPDPPRMASAFKTAVEAGRAAFEMGLDPTDAPPPARSRGFSERGRTTRRPKATSGQPGMSSLHILTSGRLLERVSVRTHRMEGRLPTFQIPPSPAILPPMQSTEPIGLSPLLKVEDLKTYFRFTRACFAAMSTTSGRSTMSASRFPREKPSAWSARAGAEKRRWGARL